MMRLRLVPSVLRRRAAQSSLAFAVMSGLAPTTSIAQLISPSSCDTGNAAKGSKTCTGTVSVTVPSQGVVELVLSASTLSLIDNSLAAEDYEAGFKTNGSLTATGRADTSFVVTMAAAAANFTYSGSVSPAPTKSASTLQASTDGGTTWNGLTTAGATIVNVGAGGSSGTVKTIQFRTLLGYETDPPGTYSLSIKFTITAP